MPSALLAESTSAATSHPHLVPLGMGLFALATAIVLRVAWSNRRGTSTPREILQQALTVAWLVPAIAAVAWIGIRSSDHLELTAVATRDNPTAEPSRQLIVPGHPWTSTTEVERDRDRRPVIREPIASGPWSTADEARREAIHRAASRLKQDVERVYGQAGDWNLPQDRVFLEQCLTDREVETTQPHKLSALAPASDMHYCVVELELSERTRQLAVRHWKRKVGSDRLPYLASFTGMLCLLVITCHLFLRLDQHSAGVHSGKLQLAAASTVIAAALILTTWLG